MNELDIQKEREIFEAVFGVNKVHRKVDYLFKQDMYEAHDYNKKSHQNYAKEVNLRWSGWKQAKRHTLKSNDWISVEDRLPEQSGQYLVFKSEPIFENQVVEEVGISEFFSDLKTFPKLHYVTHWKLLPNPPVKVEK